MTSRFILYTSFSTFCAYKNEHLPSAAPLRVGDTTHPAPSFFCWVAPEYLRPNPLRKQRVGRAGLRNCRLSSDTCSGVWMIRFLGSISVTTRFFLVIADIFFFGSSTSCWTFEGLHCEHRPTSIVVRDIEHCTVSTSMHGVVGALSMGLSAGYNSILEFLKVNIFSAMICMSFMSISGTSSSSNITHMHILVVTYLLWIFWIKFNKKMPKFLTF
jgi:hypothetical protein